MEKSRRRISIILEEGTKDGIMSLTATKWNAGILYIAPREKLTELLAMPHSNNFGVYLLLSDKKVYVGQASELRRRVKQHNSEKEKWWTKVIMLTTTNNTLDTNQITFLEAKLIELSKSCNSYESENDQKGNKYNVDAENIVDAEDYLEQILTLIEFLGIKVFVKGAVSTTNYFQIVDQKVAVLKDKKGVLEYLAEKGYKYKSSLVSYAPRGQRVDEYAIDASNVLLQNDWIVILNDIINYEIIHIKIAGSEIAKFGIDKFKVKNSTHKRIRIKPESLMDVSGFDFSKQEITRIKYVEE